MRGAWLLGPVLGLGWLLACDLPPERSGRGPRVVASEPVHGQEDVDRAAILRVFFDQRLMPGDVHRGNVTVVSGARTASSAPRFDPIDRVLLVETSLLDPSVVWRLRVENVRDLDGRRLEEPWEIAFHTGQRDIGEPSQPAPSFEQVGPLLQDRCARQGCHAAPEPALGLDLSSAEGVRSTAIGVLARQTRTGVMADQPWYGTSSLAGLARIDVVGGVGRPAHSYLMYKMLGDSHVWGEPMPPDAPLEARELRLLSRWILAGAPTD